MDWICHESALYSEYAGCQQTPRDHHKPKKVGHSDMRAGFPPQPAEDQGCPAVASFGAGPPPAPATRTALARTLHCTA